MDFAFGYFFQLRIPEINWPEIRYTHTTSTTTLLVMDQTKSDLIYVCHTIHRWQRSKLLGTQQDIKVCQTETKTGRGQGAMPKCIGTHPYSVKSLAGSYYSTETCICKILSKSKLNFKPVFSLCRRWPTSHDDLPFLFKC